MYVILLYFFWKRRKAMCKKELTEQAIQALNDLMCEFIKRYAPAKSWEQADEHFTSSEIAEMFNSVYPIPLENIFEALKSNGFTCVPLSGQPTFVWLLTLKQKKLRPGSCRGFSLSFSIVRILLPLQKHRYESTRRSGLRNHQILHPGRK